MWEIGYGEFWEKPRGGGWHLLGLVIVIILALFLFMCSALLLQSWFDELLTHEEKVRPTILGFVLGIAGVGVIGIGIRIWRHGEKKVLEQRGRRIPSVPLWPLYVSGVLLAELRILTEGDWQNLKQAGWVDIFLIVAIVSLLVFYVISRIRA